MWFLGKKNTQVLKEARTAILHVLMKKAISWYMFLMVRVVFFCIHHTLVSAEMLSLSIYCRCNNFSKVVQSELNHLKTKRNKNELLMDVFFSPTSTRIWDKKSWLHKLSHLQHSVSGKCVLNYSDNSGPVMSGSTSAWTKKKLGPVFCHTLDNIEALNYTF